ncbi:maleate cis-trans isomerase family protein [Roseobacteraceae bacterium S113]
MKTDTQRPGSATVTRLAFSNGEGVGARARLGLLVLESDQTMEWEMRLMTHLPGVAVYHARLPNETFVTPQALAKMEAELPNAAGLLPGYLGLAAIGYGCTSGATIIGETRVAELVHNVHPGMPVTDPLTAAKAAFAALGVRRAGLVTPYAPDVTLAMQDRFADAGFPVTAIGSFYERDDVVVGRIDPQSILDAALSVGAREDVDGVFISCTSLRAAGVIEDAERILGKPVTASNHALAWHLLRLAGIKDETAGFGRLFHTQNLA